MARLCVSAGALLALLLWAARRGGADFEAYRCWARVSASGDIFRLGSEIESPMGVPAFQWSHGPGLVFSVAKVVLGDGIDETQGALGVGWASSLVLWLALFGLLHHASRGRTLLTLAGAAIAFVATYAGYASIAHASESLSCACVAVLAYVALVRRRIGLADLLVAGASASLLIAVRSQLALYALVGLAALAWRLREQGRIGRAALPALLAGIGALEVAFVNRWMTGSMLRSPYSFGGEGFTSVDPARPELVAVLAHPWHGWLVYHPLAALGLLALAVAFFRARSTGERWLLGGLAVAIASHVWLQASWYCWWLGTGTFGMRGLAVASIVLVPLFVRTFGESRLSLAAALAAGLWSFALLWQGQTNFFAWEHFLDGQARTALDPAVAWPAAVLAVVTAAFLWWRRVATGSAFSARSLQGVVALALGSLAALYLGREQVGASPAQRSLAMAAIATIGAVALAWIGDGRARPPAALRRGAEAAVGALVVAAFLVTAASFARVAIRTERFLAERPPAQRTWRMRSSTSLDEVRATYEEYLWVEGFGEKKEALRRFLEEAERTASAER